MKYLVIGGTSLFGKVLLRKIVGEKDTDLVVATKLPQEKIVEVPGVICMTWTCRTR